MLGAVRIEPGRAVLDGEQPVAGKVIALRENGLGQRFGRQALDRIALEGGDADAHGLSIEGGCRGGKGSGSMRQPSHVMAGPVPAIPMLKSAAPFGSGSPAHGR